MLPFKVSEMADIHDSLGIHGRIASRASQSGVGFNNLETPTIHGKNCFQGAGNALDELAKSGGEGRAIWRFALQSAARQLLPREGVATCMRGVRPREGHYDVSVLYAPVGQIGHFGGLQICRSVWMCPVCAAKISEKRRDELAGALRLWTDTYQNEARRLLLVTFTLQHERADNLSDVLGALKVARRRLVSGRESRVFNETYGCIGTIRSLEITYGANGWHPHLHVLMFFDREVPILPFTAAIKARWSECVAAAGGYASWLHGCDVRFSDKDIAEYIAKWGKEPKWTVSHEMTKGVAKAGRTGGSTPMQLLADYWSGDRVAGRLWLQYAVNLKGERQLWWSHGLRDRLGLGEEKTDEELAEEQEEIAIVLASLSYGTWRVVLANDARGELLEAAGTGDAGKVKALLLKLGILGSLERDEFEGEVKG